MSAPAPGRAFRVATVIIPGVLFVALSGVAAQTLPQVTNLSALIEYPAFYTDRTVVVRGRVHDLNGRLSLEDEEGHRVLLASKSEGHADELVDVTGALFDVGRMKQDDPRLAGYDLARIVGNTQDWPRPGDLFVFGATRFVPADATVAAATIRSLVLEGDRASGRQVTVAGQFRGRNLFGDMPRAPGVSRNDFVIRSGDAAIWVTGMQARGKDFEFDPDRRIDSNRWLQVTGTVRVDRGLMVIQATKLALAQPQTIDSTQGVGQVVAVPPAAPPEVLFSVPQDGETQVSPTIVVRIQLSRPVDRASLVNRIRVGYVPVPGLPSPGIESTTDLEERGNAPGGAVAVLRIRFAQPLERFRSVRIELVEGIKSPDGQPLKPWRLTFSVGQ